MRAVVAAKSAAGRGACALFVLLGAALLLAMALVAQAQPATTSAPAAPAAPAAPRISEQAVHLDASLRTPLSDIKQAPFASFVGPLSVGFRSNPTWVRLTIDPGVAAGGRLLLSFNPSYVDEVQLFDPDSPESAGRRVRATGDRVAVGPEDDLGLRPGFELNAGEAPRTLYLRIDSRSFHHVSFALDEARSGARSIWVSGVVAQVLVLGLFVAVLLWSVLAWWQDREPLLAVFIVKQVLAIAHTAVLLGLVRVAAPQGLASGALDFSFALLTLLVTPATGLFELMLLREVRPPGWLWKASAATLSLSVMALVALLAGDSQLGVMLNMAAVVIYPLWSLLLALTGRVWAEAGPDDVHAPIPRGLFVAYHVLFAATVSAAALRAFGVPVVPAAWVVPGLFCYALITNVLVLVLLQSRRRAREAHNRRVEQRLSLAERTASEQVDLRRRQMRFLANASHELRTPLNGILGLAELGLADTADDAQRREHLLLIHQAGQSLARILTDVLDAAQLEAGQMRFERVDFEPARLIEELRPAHEALARGKGLRFEVSLDPELPARLHGDPQRLRQVLLNYLSNALKFTDSGSISLRVKVASADSRAVRLRLEVADTGPGLPEDIAQRLFQRFVQADSSTTRRHGGSGLGLSICREIAEAMQGEVGLDTTIGHGTTFWAEVVLARPQRELPAEPAPQAASGSPDPGTAAGPAAAFLQGRRVLLVDDNPLNRKVVLGMLGRLGLEVVSAEDGRQALEAVHESLQPGGARFDAVLMDLHMPVMDGLDATRAIRQLPGAQSLPILALTAAALPAERAEALAAGLDDFLVKPVNRAALLEHLGAAMLRGRPAPAPG